MLTALENGVKGGKWFSLMDKVYAMTTLQAAWRQVHSNQGSQGLHQRMPNAFFADYGLFTMEEAHVNPDEEILDWRAVCGKTARTVRREGRVERFFSTPISFEP